MKKQNKTENNQLKLYIKTFKGDEILLFEESENHEIINSNQKYKEVEEMLLKLEEMKIENREYV